MLSCYVWLLFWTLWWLPVWSNNMFLGRTHIWNACWDVPRGKSCTKTRNSPCNYLSAAKHINLFLLVFVERQILTFLIIRWLKSYIFSTLRSAWTVNSMWSSCLLASHSCQSCASINIRIRKSFLHVKKFIINTQITIHELFLPSLINCLVSWCCIYPYIRILSLIEIQSTVNGNLGKFSYWQEIWGLN